MDKIHRQKTGTAESEKPTAGKHVLRFKITAIANNNALKLERVVLRPVAGR